MLIITDYGHPERKLPSLNCRKSTPTPKFLGTVEAYFVCHIGPNFQISLIYAFIGCPQSVLKIIRLYPIFYLGKVPDFSQFNSMKPNLKKKSNPKDFQSGCYTIFFKQKTNLTFYSQNIGCRLNGVFYQIKQFHTCHFQDKFCAITNIVPLQSRQEHMYMASEKLANLRQKIVTRPTLYTYYLVRVHTFSSNWITTSFLPGSRHTLCGKSILKSHIDQVSPSIISLYQFGIRQTTANSPYKKVSRFCNFLYCKSGASLGQQLTQGFSFCV